MTEKEFYTEDFEQMLKEKADQFSMYPSKRVWYSIYNNLHPGRRWPSVAICLFLISSLMFIGYLNSGDSSITRQINNNSVNENSLTTNGNKTISNKKYTAPAIEKAQKNMPAYYNNVFKDVLSLEKDFFLYTVVRSNRPDYMNINYSTAVEDTKATDNTSSINNNEDIIQSIKTYITSNQIFADIAVFNNKNKVAFSKSNNNELIEPVSTDEVKTAATQKNTPSSFTNSDIKNEPAKFNETDKKINPEVKLLANLNSINDEKAWIENFTSENKPRHNKSKGRWDYKVYITPAVNYRKLTINSNGSGTPLANSDINSLIKQKPGFGFEAGAGFSYTLAKKLRFITGLQFNYTNYNIHADETNHPIVTSVLLNNPYTGFSFVAARTTTTSNTFNSAAIKPVTLHNKTYQLSIPLGIAYKLSTKENVDWFAGVSAQPTYIFGGKANLISSDLKTYVSEPSSIRSWNLNLGFETYMNFKLGAYHLQVGPQVRYQVNSTYKKSVALVEKPYAVGLKFGLTKGF